MCVDPVVDRQKVFSDKQSSVMSGWGRFSQWQPSLVKNDFK